MFGDSGEIRHFLQFRFTIHWRYILLFVFKIVVLSRCANGHCNDFQSLQAKYCGMYGNYSEAAIAAMGYPCATIGKHILQNGGSAVDAAVAATLCMGVVAPESMGVGGGFLMTVYIRDRRKAFVLNAREMAPLEANEALYGSNKELASKGGLAVGIPGELKGMWDAHNRFGTLPWNDLVQPSIKLCREGILVSGHLAKSLKEVERDVTGTETLREIFLNPSTGKTWKEGETMLRPKFAEFLERVADEGVDVFYKGELGKQFANDVQEFGGIITEEDLAKYWTDWQKPVTTKLGDFTLYTTPLPGSGLILSFMLRILHEIIPDEDPVVMYQRIVETMKFSYAKRSFLGDDNIVEVSEIVANLTSSDFIRSIINDISDTETHNDPSFYGVYYNAEDHGTGHVCVLAPNGDAVSITSTINYFFGAKFRSRSTGIIPNNQINDFSFSNFQNAFGIPDSAANLIEPLKQPLSSMVPSILVDDDGDVRLVVGAAGGSRIISTVATIIINHVWFNRSLKDAVNTPRLHHQLLPMKLFYEEGFPKEYVEGLEKIGHKTAEVNLYSMTSTATSISREEGKVYAMGDARRLAPGAIDGF